MAKRIQITLTDDEYRLVRKLSKLTERPMSKVVGEFVSAGLLNVPAILEAMEYAQSVQERIKADLEGDPEEMREAYEAEASGVLEAFQAFMSEVHALGDGAQRDGGGEGVTPVTVTTGVRIYDKDREAPPRQPQRVRDAG